MPKELCIEADFVTEVVVNRIKTLVVFNVKKHNADKLEKGEIIHTIRIEDETGCWVNHKACTFMEIKQSDIAPKHLKIELVE